MIIVGEKKLFLLSGPVFTPHPFSDRTTSVGTFLRLPLNQQLYKKEEVKTFV